MEFFFIPGRGGRPEARFFFLLADMVTSLEVAPFSGTLKSYGIFFLFLAGRPAGGQNFVFAGHDMGHAFFAGNGMENHGIWRIP